jgi:acyl-CoA oxidase
MYVMQLVGNQMLKYRDTMNEEVQRGKFKTLNLMHHFTSGLKSLFSQTTYDGIELIRINCGGAGYSAWSYLPALYDKYSPVPVYEGDNTVMAQQTLSYIEKKIVKIQKGVPAKGIFAYLNNIERLCTEVNQGLTIENFTDIKFLQNALSVRAAFMVRDVLTKLKDKSIKKKIKVNDLYAQDLLLMSKFHHTYMSLTIFHLSATNSVIKDPKIAEHLELLGKIYALKQLQLDSGILYETGFFKNGARHLIGEAMQKCLLQLRPQIISLVELETDELYDQSYLSAIGNKYGDIYERQLELARGSRLNHPNVPEWWQKEVKPLMGTYKL